MPGLVNGREIMFSNADSRRRNKVSYLGLVIALLLLVLFHSATSLSLDEFYPFDITGLDNKTEQKDDGGSDLIQLQVEFPFFNYTYTSLYVNNNGIISFTDKLKNYKPLNFDNPKFREAIPLVAPYWADVDIENLRGLNESVVYRVTDNSTVLDRASQDIRKYFTGQALFTAEVVVIVTWYNVGYYGATGGGKSKRNTFQAVLVSSGSQSFAIFNYNNTVWTTGSNSGGETETGLSGISGGNPGQPAVVGFSAGDFQQYYLLENSGKDAIINITQESNINTPGKYIFRLDGKVDDNSCFASEGIEISPSTVSMLGHTAILVTGPCMNPKLRVKGRIRELGLEFPCYVTAEGAAVCVPPSLFRTGELHFDLDPYGDGRIFSATLTSVNLLNMPAMVTRKSLDQWYLGNKVEVIWDQNRAPLHKPKSLEILAYTALNGSPEFHVLQRFPVTTTDISREFKLPTDVKGLNNTLVMRLCWNTTQQPDLELECLWSDVFPVRWSSSTSVQSQQWCETWLNKEKLLTPIYVRRPYCPCVVSIAENDLGQFQKDPSCDNDKTSENTNCVYNPRAHKCFRRNIKSANDSGELCCYNQGGQLMDVREYPGSGTHQRYHYRAQGENGLTGDTIMPYFSYFEADLLPRLHCCMYSQNNCTDFIRYRNATTCQDYQPPSPALAAGDPHLVTLDGKNYSFNGVGDFYLVTDINSSIVIQVRAERAIDKNGILQNATVFTSIAVTVPGWSDVLEIRKEERGAQVLANNRLQTTSNTSTSQFNNISLLHNNDGSYLIVLEPVSVSVTVEVTPDLLNIIVLIGEESFKGKLRGLLGNYNGNADDDFISRNGTTVSSAASMRDIHYDFGMTWQVADKESILSHPRVVLDSATQFQPVFIDERGSENLKNDTYEVCGNNRQCIFDYQITENKEVARSTAQFTDKFDAIKEQLEQKVVRCPYLSAPEDGNMTKTGDSEGDTATFICNQGYEMIQGTPTRVCQSDNTWSGTDVKCAKKIQNGGTTKPNIIIVAAVASTVGGVVLIAIVCSVAIFMRRRRSKKIGSPEPPIELPIIRNIPVFENAAFLKKLQDTVGDGPYRIPRPKYVDPSIFQEFF